MLYKILGEGAMDLAHALGSAGGPKAALEALVSPEEQQPDLEGIQKLAEQHGAQATTLAKYAGIVGLGTLLFFFCTLTFAVLGVPRPLVLGFVCALFAILPLVGTPLVWLPVAGGLFIIGATAKAVILLVVGGGVIGAIEFFIGPMFSKLGHLRLPPGFLLLAMFGGALGLGPVGLVLGPLLMRLAKEAVEVWREDRATG